MTDDDHHVTITATLPGPLLVLLQGLAAVTGHTRDELLAASITDSLARHADQPCPRCGPHKHTCTTRKCVREGCCLPPAFGPAQRIGFRVRSARHTHSPLTATQFAALLGISQSKLSKLELGRRRIHLGELATIADHLGVAVAELVGDDAAHVHP